jgi:cellulase/cellobiase CelA1
MMRRALLMAIIAGVLSPIDLPAQAPTTGGAVFVAYFWRAKPGQADAYSEYIRTIAEPIDEDARRAGAFEEVRTVMPAAGVTTDWTHLRIFRLKNAAAADALGAALDAATARVVPDDAKRKANSERSAGLRDFVRREVWTELR